MIHTFNLSVPKDWQSLSDSQLQYFFTQLSHDLPMEEILTLCLFKWADLRVLCKTHDGSYLVKHRQASKQEATLTIRQMLAATASLDFLRQFAPLPVRISKIGRAAAIAADFQGVPFSTFISHRQHPLRMGFPRQLRPLPSPLPTHLRHRVLHPPHRWISDTKHHRHSELHTFSKGQRIRRMEKLRNCQTLWRPWL